MKAALCVLLVDDHPENLASLDARLRAMGHRTVIVTDGVRAIESVREDRPDVVVMDVVMPEVNGYQACRTIKREHPDLPVIMLTGKTDPADKFWASECGADLFLTKPLDPAAVVREILTIVGGAG
jgi:twitching motility two-component system response regulator PilH